MTSIAEPPGCAKETKIRLREDISRADSAKLQQMVVEALDKFNDYNVDYNDEIVKKFLKINEKIETTNPALKNQRFELIFWLQLSVS